MLKRRLREDIRDVALPRASSDSEAAAAAAEPASSSSSSSSDDLDDAASRLFANQVSLNATLLRRGEQFRRSRSQSALEPRLEHRALTRRELLSRALDLSSCDSRMPLAMTRRLFVALRHEENPQLRERARALNAEFARDYASREDFKRAYADWSARISLLRQASLEIWLKTHYMQPIWQAALRAIKLHRVMHQDDANHTELTDPVARQYGTPFRHRISISALPDYESELFLVLYTDTPRFERRVDWVVEQAQLFWNCFFCLPRIQATKVFGCDLVSPKAGPPPSAALAAVLDSEPEWPEEQKW